MQRQSNRWQVNVPGKRRQDGSEDILHHKCCFAFVRQGHVFDVFYPDFFCSSLESKVAISQVSRQTSRFTVPSNPFVSKIKREKGYVTRQGFGHCVHQVIFRIQHCVPVFGNGLWHHYGFDAGHLLQGMNVVEARQRLRW